VQKLIDIKILAKCLNLKFTAISQAKNLENNLAIVCVLPWLRSGNLIKLGVVIHQ